MFHESAESAIRSEKESHLLYHTHLMGPVGSGTTMRRGLRSCTPPPGNFCKASVLPLVGINDDIYCNNVTLPPPKFFLVEVLNGAQ